MKKLARRIARELKQANHCGVYEPELSRILPPRRKKREAQIASFARLHGWRLRYFKEGFCAIFDRSG